MSLPALAVKRPVTFLMIFIGVVGIGIIALVGLRLNLFPDLELPTIAVITTYPGTAPEDMEALITKPIEEAIATVQNLDTLSSQSREGVSVVIAEFAWGADLGLAEQDVRKNIDLIEGLLPEDAEEPLEFRFDPNLVPIMGISVSGEQSPEELRLIAEKDVEPRLERIEGVATADTTGGEIRQIQIQVDREKLTARGVSLQQLLSTIQRENVVIPAGTLEEDNIEYAVRTLGEYQSVDQIARTVVTFHNGVPIYVRDVADVVDGTEEPRAITRVNGSSAVVVTVRRASGANTVQVTERILSRLPEIESVLPGIKLSVIFQEAEIIQESIGNLFQTIILAVVLCGLTLFIFLRTLRTTSIVLVAIPISVVGTFTVMSLFNVSLNVVSMGGLALGVGLFVDNSIVVLESIFRHREQGEPVWEGSVVGAGEVSTAIAASTFTTICVFFPLLFVPGISGQMFRDMSLTVVFALLVSLFVALTLIPLVSSRILTVIGERDRGVSALLGTIIERGSRLHSSMLEWCVNHRLHLLALVGGSFVLSMLVMVGFVGISFIPDVDTGSLTIELEGPAGTGLEETDKTFQVAERAIQESVPELKTMFTNIGAAGGFFGMGGEGSHAGTIRLELVKRNERTRATRDIENELREILYRSVRGVDIRFSADTGFGGGMGPPSQVNVEIYGYDLSTLLALAREVQTRLATVPGVADIENSLGETGRPQLSLRYDRDKLYDLGLSTGSVSQIVQTALQGSVASRYKEGGREYDILVRMKEEYRSTTEDIGRLRIVTPRGGVVLLQDVADTEYGRTAVTLTRKDQQRIADVSFRTIERPLGDVLTDVRASLTDIDWPRDSRWELGGSAEDLQQSFIWLGYALLVGMGLVYMVMASQFESLRNPFIIFLTIPLSAIGVAWMLFLTRTTLNLFSMIGVIVLVGIVINNSIVLIDYINLLRQRGKGIREATREAARVRFRPVLMTALTTILAMLPLALEIGPGAETWSPMARSVVGGLLAGTVSTLLVIPVLYLMFEERREKRQANDRTGG